MSRATPPEVDISADDARPGELGAEIVRKVAIKGFCVVQLGLNDRVLMEQAAGEMPGQLHCRFRVVHSAVADGLLGEEGSTCVAGVGGEELQEMALEDKEEYSYEALRLVGQKLQEVGYTQLKPHTESTLFFQLVEMKAALLHRAGPQEALEPEELTEKEHSSWLDTFVRHRVMSIFFLGPGTGNLNLWPYETDDAEIYHLPTSVGTMVVLRPDLLMHTWSCHGRSFAMSIFGLTSRFRPRTHVELPAIVPAARELERHRIHRLAVLKHQEMRSLLGGFGLQRQVPRSWQKAMNQLFPARQLMSVRGSSCRMPGQHSGIKFWTQLTINAPDYAKEVPLLRWDHTEVYSTEEESWRNNKTYCKHGTFIDIEFFGCRRFGISFPQAQEMDPHQRLTLEVGYEALCHMGMQKETLRNANCGVYTGCGDSEWAFREPVANTGPPDSLGVSAGRFSFCLGLSGPSLNVNTDGSSSLVALHMASESLWNGSSSGTDFSVAAGVHLCLASTFWPSWCAASLLSHGTDGRCRTFDDSASGYIRGEGCCAAAVSRQGEDIPSLSGQVLPFEGHLAGSCVKSGGLGANLSTPSAQAQQEAMVEALKLARVKPQDVDYLEAHGSGEFLGDAVEVMSHVRVHRGLVSTSSAADEGEGPLQLTALKSSTGNQVACGGLASFLRSLAAANVGLLLPNMHLRQVNENLPLEQDVPVLFDGEGQEMPDMSPVMGTFARGFGGSYVYVVANGHTEEEHVSWSAPATAQELIWWPGGGGVQELPRGEYYLAGTWSNWKEPTKMSMESRGVFSGMVTLGENCWELFQIWVDGNQERVLHPDKLKAPNETAVMGPNKRPEFCWKLDGRRKAKQRREEEADAGEWVLVDAPADAESPEQIVESLDTGQPGDRYRVKLQIKGKWAMVSWEWSGPPLRSGKSQESMYYLWGSWNDWRLQEAVAMDSKEPGLFHGEVTLTRDSAEFQIARNQDSWQVLYPSSRCTEGDGPVLGPDGPDEALDDENGGMGVWVLTGTAGDVFAVQLTRKWRGGVDVKRVSWQRIKEVEPKQEQLELARTPHWFCIVWGDETRSSMYWTGTCYEYFVELGQTGEELFYILRDGQNDQAFFPNVRGASTHKFHVITGPRLNERRVHWNIGKHKMDMGGYRERYRIEMLLNKDGTPKDVKWTRVVTQGSSGDSVLALTAESSTTRGSTEGSAVPNSSTSNGSGRARSLATPERLPLPGAPAEAFESASDQTSSGATEERQHEVC